MKKQWGGLLTFIMIAALSIPAAGQAPAADSSGQASGQAPAAAAATPAPAAAPAAPAPLPTPSMTAPLSTAAPPHTFSAGPFGTVAITGILSGIGMTQSNWIPGDKSTHWDLSNGQIFLQKTTGWWQFYLQAGAYNLPDLGVPFLKTTDTLTALYGPLPVAYLKLVKGNFNVEIGELPTLVGAEYTFDFENMNIERGLLWNQENAISRGVQLSDTFKKLSLTVSWNDGFYSNVYNWITGSAMYQFNAANSLMFVGGGNVGQTAATNNPIATPLALANEVRFTT